jgi:hypothetical protein
LLGRAVEVLRPQRVTIVVTKKPFAPAIAASRGEKTRDIEAWLETLVGSLGSGVGSFAKSLSGCGLGLAFFLAAPGRRGAHGFRKFLLDDLISEARSLVAQT